MSSVIIKSSGLNIYYIYIYICWYCDNERTLYQHNEYIINIYHVMISLSSLGSSRDMVVVYSPLVLMMLMIEKLMLFMILLMNEWTTGGEKEEKRNSKKILKSSDKKDQKYNNSFLIWRYMYMFNVMWHHAWCHITS